MTDPDPSLSPLESTVMQVLWNRGSATAEHIRRALSGSRDLTDSTVRTLLRRMEAKGFVAHEIEGRTFVYQALLPAAAVAAKEVRSIVDRLCGGSVENLLLGMVDTDLVTEEQLEKLMTRIAEAEAGAKETRMLKEDGNAKGGREC